MVEPKTFYELITETLNERFKGKYYKWGFVEGRIVNFSFTEESFLEISVVQEDTELGGEYPQTFTFTQKNEGKWWLMECLKKWKIYDSEEEMRKANLKIEIEKLRARVCGDYELFDGEMFKVIKILRDAGFIVTATPVSGVPVELNYGSETYVGLEDITKFVNSFKDKYRNKHKT